MLVEEKINKLVWFHFMELIADSTHIDGFIATMRVFGCGLINMPFFSRVKKIIYCHFASEKRKTERRTALTEYLSKK